MCLAIPGKIVELIEGETPLARVEVGGVRRVVNVGLLDDAKVGEYVLIHVGFAMSKVNEQEAEETLRLLQELGAYQEEVAQFADSVA